MSEKDTRDIAVAAETKIDAHVQDCINHREAIQNFMIEIRADIKRINWYLPLIIGGIVVLGHMPDWIVAMSGHLIGR